MRRLMEVVSKLRDIESTPAAEDAVGSSGRNVIAVIGINRYEGWQRLTNAVDDALGAAALFRSLGFEEVTQPLLDDKATGKAIQELVTDDLRVLGPEDSLVLFYAGHGGVREHRLGNEVVKTGHLIPVDASDKGATWIELDGWLRAVSLLPAKHILVILDACHSGIALGQVIKWRDTSTWQKRPLPKLKARRSRRIITSALDDQVALDSGPVHGHSLFTGCLIEGLTHGLGRAGSRVATGSELGLYLQRRVETYPNSRQTPDFGTFDFDNRGEMVIPFLIQEPVPEPVENAIAQPLPVASRLPFVARGAVVLGLIAAVAIAVSRDDPSPPTPSAPQEREPAPALAPAPIPDAGVSPVPSDAPPAAAAQSRPPAVAPRRPLPVPLKIEPEPRPELRTRTVPASDGMLEPRP